MKRTKIIDFGNIILLIISVLLLLLLSVNLVFDQTALAIKIFFVCLLCLAVYYCISRPICIVIEENKISSHFLFGFYEEIKLEDIELIKRTKMNSHMYFRVLGKTSGKHAFFGSVIIPNRKIVRETLKEYFENYGL